MLRIVIPACAVYPCTYRELPHLFSLCVYYNGISLYLQGTPPITGVIITRRRYIPVPTGNSNWRVSQKTPRTVYPCTYRERG